LTDTAFYEAAYKLLDTIFDFRESPTVSYRSTVLLEDYRRARAEFPLMMPAEALCVDGCIGNLVFPTEDDIPAIIYFDRGEPFRAQIEDVRRQRRKLLDRDWSRQIKDILPTDWTERGIQAADLFAWLSNTYEVLKRREDASKDERRMTMDLSLHAFFSAYPRGMVYDYDKIVAAYQRRQK